MSTRIRSYSRPGNRDMHGNAVALRLRRSATQPSSSRIRLAGGRHDQAANPGGSSERAAKGGVRRDLDGGRLLAGPIGLADLLEGLLATRAVQPVDEQHPVQVICLVLDTAGEQVAAFYDDRVAVLVEPLGHDTQRTLGVIGQPRQRQATPPPILLLV